MSRRLLLFTCVLSALLARAARAETSQREGGDTSVARGHFQRAEAAFSEGRFDQALAGYEAAYKAKPLPGLLFNVAQCHRNLGKQERALFYYRRYLSLDPRTPNRALVEQLIGESEKKVAASRAAPAASASERTEPPPIAAPPLPLGKTGSSPTGEPPPRSMSKADRPGAPASAISPPPVVVETDRPRARQPLHRRWWVWAAVGGAVLAGTTAALLSRGSSPRPAGELGALDWR
jgi:tetratricopeptide (TPR) repeat protein